jgi:hypothetical protein
MVSLIVFLKLKGYPFKVLLKRTRGLVLNKNSCLEFLLLAFSECFASGHVSGELPVSPLVLSLPLFFSHSVFLCSLSGLCCGVCC